MRMRFLEMGCVTFQFMQLQKFRLSNEVSFSRLAHLQFNPQHIYLKKMSRCSLSEDVRVTRYLFSKDIQILIYKTPLYLSRVKHSTFEIIHFVPFGFILTFEVNYVIHKNKTKL